MDASSQKHTLAKTLEVYFQWPVFWVFMLGIASGFPLLLTSSTLAARLSESGVNIKLIGIFALCGLPYTFKFLISPIIDAIVFPGIRTHLGHRKSWCILTQILLVVSMIGMAWCKPESQTFLLGIFAFATACFSAMQDIVIDALRIEILPKDAQGAGAAANVAGYRIGMLLAGAGALMLATFVSWQMVYVTGAAVMAVCIGVTALLGTSRKPRKTPQTDCFAVPESAEDAVQKSLTLDELVDSDAEQTDPVKEDGETESRDILGNVDNKPKYIKWVQRAVVDPITDFFKRPYALVILLFIALFKLGDAMAGSLSMPFYLEMGFSKAEIAAITKVIGVVAVLGGTFLGGFIVKGMPIIRALAICGTLQILSNFVFVWLANVGADISVLTVCIVVENVTGGMGTAAFVAYISQLCNVRFTATQYALLSSLSSVGRTAFSASAGVLVAEFGWSWFYVSTAGFGIPGMIFLYLLWRLEQNDNKTNRDSVQAFPGTSL
ncbi:MAG: MFS transporter [Proteobacteria bacterium]|nr:MFS transporter [Pseudomonadota bacterium]